MKRKKRVLSLLLMLFLWMISVLCYAEGFSNPTTGTVTSPFGPREAPTAGASTFHHGIDIAGEAGDPVVASASGTVEFAGWADGYGNVIYIRHDNGYQTRYAHLSGYIVGVGQRVGAGELIGYQGNTGIGTGAHLHFEIRTPDGKAIDPATMVTELGAYVSGYGPSSAEGDGKYLNWELVDDFAKPITDLIEKLIDLFTKGLDLLKNQVAELFFVLVSIDLAIGAMNKALTPTEEDSEGLFKWIVRRGVFYGFCMILLYNWSDIVGNLSLYGFPHLGGIAGGDEAAAEAAVSDPTQIVQKGMTIVAPLFNSTFKGAHLGGGLMAILGAGEFLIHLILAGILFALFCIIGIQIARAYIEFYATVLFSLSAFPMAGVKFVRQYASNGINSVLAAGINLMFFCLFASMLQSTMADLVVPDMVSQGQVRSVTPASQAGASTNAAIEGPEVYIQMAREAAQKWGVPVDLFLAQIQTESGWDPNADNGVARDIAQFTDETAAGWGIDPFNPAEALDAAAHYDHNLYEKFGSWELAFAGYNAGPGNVEKYGGIPPFPETIAYVAKIYGGEPIGAAIRGTVQAVWHIGVILQVILLVLAFMFMGDRISKLIHMQFGNAGFRLSDKQGVFS